MDRKMDYLKTGNVEIAQFNELDGIFLSLSNEEQGLTFITESNYLEEILFSREDIDDVIYTLKFLAEKESYERIIDSEASSFTRLEEKEREEVVKYAKIFHNILNNTPTVYSFSEIKAGEQGLFIAYVYSEQYTVVKNNQNIHIAWKADREDFRIFEEILKISQESSKDFPQKLRMAGNISISDKGEKIYVDFSGNSSKGENSYTYSPRLLAQFEENIKDVFTKKDSFREKEIEICF